MDKTVATLVYRATAVAIDGRAVLIEGEPGVGKSSLALALIDRGATLIGDDGITLSRKSSHPETKLIASPPPNIEGLIEVRGVGLVPMEVATPAPVALILRLIGHDAPDPERLPERAQSCEILGCRVPVLPFRPGAIAPAERARHALNAHGLKRIEQPDRAP